MTIVNHYGKDVTIMTTHPNPKYHRFRILNGENYKIKSEHSINVTMHIKAYDGLIPIQIDGKNSVRLSSSPTRRDRVYYVPTGELMLRLHFTKLLSITFIDHVLVYQDKFMDIHNVAMWQWGNDGLPALLLIYNLYFDDIIQLNVIVMYVLYL